MNKQIVQAVKALRVLTYNDFKFAVSLARPDAPIKRRKRRKKPGPKPGTKRSKPVAEAAAAPVRKARRIEAPSAPASNA